MHFLLNQFEKFFCGFVISQFKIYAFNVNSIRANTECKNIFFLKQPKIEALKACPTFVELNDLK